MATMVVLLLVLVVTVFDVTKLSIHIRDIIPDRSAILDFLLDGATFRVHSTFHTC